MQSLDRFRSRMGTKGGSLRGEHIKDSRLLLDHVFLDDPSLTPGVYMWELGKLGKESYIDDEPIIIRLYDRRFSNANGWMESFQTLYNTPILSGDTLYDSNMDAYFICTEVFNIDDIHWQGRLIQCNWILKWQLDDGTILEYPCIDQNTTQYNSGETSNRQFTIGTSQHMLTLPLDENTVALSSPKRFFLDNNFKKPTVFVVTQNDTTSYAYGKKGLIHVTLFEDPFRPDTDRIDLGICDYISPESMIHDNSDNVFISKSVINYATLAIKSGGDKQTFNGSFYDDAGNVVDGIDGKWEIISDFTNKMEVESNGNSISIGIDNDDYVDEEFKLRFSDADGNFSSSVIVKIDSLL